MVNSQFYIYTHFGVYEATHGHFIRWMLKFTIQQRKCCPGCGNMLRWPWICIWSRELYTSESFTRREYINWFCCGCCWLDIKLNLIYTASWSCRPAYPCIEPSAKRTNYEHMCEARDFMSSCVHIYCIRLEAAPGVAWVTNLWTESIQTSSSSFYTQQQTLTRRVKCISIRFSRSPV